MEYLRPTRHHIRTDEDIVITLHNIGIRQLQQGIRCSYCFDKIRDTTRTITEDGIVCYGCSKIHGLKIKKYRKVKVNNDFEYRSQFFEQKYTNFKMS